MRPDDDDDLPVEAWKGASDTARRSGAGGAGTSSSGSEGSELSSSGCAKKPISPIGDGTCRSFKPAETEESTLIPELDEVGETERNMLPRKPPQPLPAFGLAEDLGGTHVLEVLVHVSLGKVLPRCTIASPWPSGSLAVAAVHVAVVAKERPESLRDSNMRPAPRNALGLIMLGLYGLGDLG